MVSPNPDLEGIRQTVRRGIDFVSLVKMACDHSVRPLLIRTLTALSWENVPRSVRIELMDFQRIHAGFCLAAAEQLGFVVAALTAHRVRVATFKGATTAIILHGDLAAREYNDIDVIVPLAQVDKAQDVLESIGYRGPFDDRRFRRAFLAYQRQYMFRHPVQPTVDLHWAFTGSHLPFPLDIGEIWPTLATLRIGPRQVPAVSGADLALLLAGHGTKEGWLSLGWVCDFAQLIERRRDLDWVEIHRRAHRRGCGDSILLACSMADRLLNIAVPAALAQRLAARVRVGDLAAALVDDLRQGLPASQQRDDLADLILCDRPADKVRAVVKLALTPTPRDHAGLPLPPALWPLYRLTRPFRLAVKAIGHH
jgi:hypothetical protein